ncbi:MAG: TIM barrel protein [Bacteroidota bacterium]
MIKIQLACETYTWQMPGEHYKGKLEHIMDVVARAGFKGIEPETSFLHHLEDPALMKAALDKYGLELSVLCVVEDWLHPKETDEERARADKWIDFLEHFPNTILLPVQMPQTDRSNLRERQQNLLNCVNAFAQRASDRGIICSYHPNSPKGSIYRTKEDYEILLEGLNEEIIGYCPDVGHIAKGGMDPLEIIKQYRSVVNLVHYKDMNADGTWAETGKGIIDFVGITNYLVETDYKGWIVMEDECDECITNPDGATLKDGIFIDEVIRPLL